jgi:hypothetical protein
MTEHPARLAIVGHTNTGKTSLMRTLTRDPRFGEVSDRPATTRDVRAVDLLVDDTALITLYDTPGLEDPDGLAAHLQTGRAAADPVAGIEWFLNGDHGEGRYEQEAKVLRQLRASDAALYVIDAREPVLPRHHTELRLLSDCGRPLLPVLNFVADTQARAAAWREGLARSGLHVVADFDTVVFEAQAEQSLLAKLQILLDARRAPLARFAQHRRKRQSELRDDACSRVARLLIDAAGVRQRVAVSAEGSVDTTDLEARITAVEQACVDDLLDLFAFDLGTYQPPVLPLEQGRWQLDPFDPQALQLLGIRTGSAAAAGAVGGLSVDALLGGASLGAGAAIGAGIGALGSAYQQFGQPWVDRLRGYRTLVIEAPVLALLAARQVALLRALLRRGHAATQPLQAPVAQGWPSTDVRKAVLQARTHPEWSALNGAAEAPAGFLRTLTHALARAVDESVQAEQPSLGSSEAR